MRFPPELRRTGARRQPTARGTGCAVLLNRQSARPHLETQASMRPLTSASRVTFASIKWHRLAPNDASSARPSSAAAHDDSCSLRDKALGRAPPHPARRPRDNGRLSVQARHCLIPFPGPAPLAAISRGLREHGHHRSRQPQGSSRREDERSRVAPARPSPEALRAKPLPRCATLPLNLPSHEHADEGDDGHRRYQEQQCQPHGDGDADQREDDEGQ